MARMHPEDIDSLEGPTEGGRKVFRFLPEATRPDQDFIGWYEPAIGEQGREPDFVLFGEQLGLMALEVKYWLIDPIEEAAPPRPIPTGRTNTAFTTEKRRAQR
jgi:hypothetical protein